MSDNSSDASTDEEADAEGNGECFVIAPIGDPRTETRRQTDGLLNEAIRPVIEEELGLDVTAAHELPEAGSITRQVIQRLLEAELVVADLTGLNANVMYELAVRHAKGKPIVPIAERGTSLPFDITTERTIFYEDSMHGLNELKPQLREVAEAALAEEEPDNPIYRAQQDFQMREITAEDEEMTYVLDRLNDIEAAISKSNSESSGQRRHPPTIGSPPVVKEKEYLFEGPPDQLDELVQQLGERLLDAGATIHEIMPVTTTEEGTQVLSMRHNSPQRLVDTIIDNVADEFELEYRGNR